jgi:cell division protein FtsW (lipid II flippase)
MPFNLTHHPRRLAGVCAAGAIGLGLGYFALAGAPTSYFAMNGAAFLLGVLTLGVIVEAGRLWRIRPGPVLLLLAAILVTVSFRGVSTDGVTRWVAVGGIVLQPSLIVVPVIVLGFACSRDRLSALAVMIAALALALQPDRAMAAALAAGVLALALGRRGRLEMAALATALLGFCATMIQADASQAMPFVDQIFFTSFAVHPGAGLMVWCGAALMLAPAILGFARDPRHRVAYAAFGALWLTVLAAAALGNYPTPLVGYGGSAILGYLLCLIGLPQRRASPEAGQARKADTVEPKAEGSLRIGLA